MSDKEIIPMTNSRKKVAFVGQPEYFCFCYPSSFSWAEVKEFEWRFGENIDVENIIQYNPDITFFFRGEFIPRDLLRTLTGVKVCLSSEPFPRHIQDNKLNFTRDSFVRYINFRMRIRNLPFDYVFHYDAKSLKWMANDGLFVSNPFPFPVDTKTYFDKKLERKWDFFFIGRSTRHREKFFARLKHEYKFLHINHGIFGEDLVDYICSAHINLNIHAEDEISWEPRVQMLLSCGAFLISEKISSNDYLRPGIDYIEISSPTEAYEAAQYYLNHPEEMKPFRHNSRKRIIEKLDADVNFHSLCTSIENKAIEKFHIGKGRLTLDALTHLYKLMRKLKQ